MEPEQAVDDLRNSSGRLLELLKLSFISATAFISFATLGRELPIEKFSTLDLLQRPIIMVGIGLWFLSLLFISGGIVVINPNISAWQEVARGEKSGLTASIRLGISPRRSNWIRRVSLILVTSFTSCFFLGSADYVLSLMNDSWSTQLTLNWVVFLIIMFGMAIVFAFIYIPIIYNISTGTNQILRNILVKTITYPPESAYKKLNWMRIVDFEILKQTNEHPRNMRIDELANKIDRSFIYTKERCKLLAEKNLLTLDRGYHVQLGTAGEKYLERDYPFDSSPINFRYFYRPIFRALFYLIIIGFLIIIVLMVGNAYISLI